MSSWLIIREQGIKILAPVCPDYRAGDRQDSPQKNIRAFVAKKVFLAADRQLTG